MRTSLHDVGRPARRFLGDPDHPGCDDAAIRGDFGTYVPRGTPVISKEAEHGPHYKEMLKSIGVDSIKELRHGNSAHLKQMIEERHGPVVGLSEHETQTWIDEAKAYQE